MVSAAAVAPDSPRDLGYPGGELRPAIFDRQAARGLVRPGRVAEAEPEAQ